MDAEGPSLPRHKTRLVYTCRRGNRLYAGCMLDVNCDIPLQINAVGVNQQASDNDFTQLWCDITSVSNKRCLWVNETIVIQ